MKKLFAAIFLSLFIFASTAFTQKNEDLDNFEVIGRSSTMAYLVNFKDAVVNKAQVTFVLLIAGAEQTEKGLALDPDNHVFMTLKADCNTHDFVVMSRKGAIDGKPFSQVFPAAKMTRAAEDSTPDKVISIVCEEKVGVSVE